MKVAVCINHVPDTETKIKIAADSRSIDRAGVNFMMGPYDEIAVEEGLRMRDKFKGEVIVHQSGRRQSTRKPSGKPLRWGSTRPCC